MDAAEYVIALVPSLGPGGRFYVVATALIKLGTTPWKPSCVQGSKPTKASHVGIPDGSAASWLSFWSANCPLPSLLSG